MGAPQIIVIILFLLNLIGASFSYGSGKSSGAKFIGAVLGVALYGGLLLWGGFFS